MQVCAQGCEGPVFLCRPLAAEHEPSSAPRSGSCFTLALIEGNDFETALFTLGAGA